MPKKVVYSVVLVSFLLFHPPVFADTIIVINELLPMPSSGNDWVELYNPSQNDIDVSGWILDDEGTSSDMLKIPDNTIIAKQSFKLFHVSNRLNKNGDTIYLKNGASEIDKYQYTTSDTDVTFGRYPDGSDNWNTCSPTPESTNSNCEVIVDPNPTPTPQSTTSQTTSSTSGKSKSPSPSTKVSPSPTSQTQNSKTASVLGSSRTQESTKSPVTEINSSASPTPSAESKAEESSNRIKIAGAVAGSGAIIMGLSAGLYFWFRRKSVSEKEESGNN